MATQILQAPNELSLSDDPVVLKIETDNHISEAGTKAYFELLVATGGVVGDTFSLYFNGVEHEFELVAGTPDDSGCQIQLPGTTNASWTQNYLVPALQTNYYFGTYFDITYQLSGLNPLAIIEAKQVGEDYSLDLSNESWLSANANTPGVDRATHSNFKVVVDLDIESQYGSGNYDVRVPLIAPAYEDSSASVSASVTDAVALFDLGRYIRPYFDRYLPSPAATVMQKSTHTLRRYKITHAERYGTSPRIQKPVRESTVFYCMKGGTAYPFTYDHPDIVSDWLTNDKWLTWEPDGKLMGETQPEFLGYLSLAAQDIELEVKLHYTDGTTSPWQIADSLTAAKFDIYYVPVGYTEVVAQFVTSGKTVHKWQVRLTDASNVIAEERTYYLDRSRLDETLLYYYNSFSILTSLRSFNSRQEIETVTAMDFDTFLPADAGRYDREGGAEPGMDNGELVLTSGWGTESAARHVKELFFSEEVFLLEGGYYKPYVLTSRRIVPHETRESIYATELRLRRSRTNRHYSV